MMRHLRTCREVTELALVMARKAAQAAEHEWTPEPAPEPEPAPAQEPAPKPAQPARNPAPETTRSKSTRRYTYISPSVAFTRLASCIRQTMALEARFAAKLAADTERAETRARDHAWREAERAARVVSSASRPTPTPTQAQDLPRPKPTPEIPSLLATIGQEIGIDLEGTSRNRSTGPP